MLKGTPADIRSYRWGVFLVLAAGTCWSLIGLGIRHIESATVWQILLYRSLALTPVLFIVITQRSSGRPFQSIRTTGVAGVIGGSALVAAFASGIYAIQMPSVAAAMFMFASAPFMTAVLGIAVLGEPVRKETWICMGVAAIGVTIMVAGELAIGYWAGISAALASAFGFSVFTITLRWKKTEDMMPTVFQVGAGLVLYTLGSRLVPAGELALLSMSEVVLGPFWVWLFLSETVSLSILVGGGLLLGALAGNAISGLRRKPPPVTLG